MRDVATVQKEIFRWILSELKCKGQSREALQTLLGVGRTALQARISGKKGLQLNELLLLLEHFELPRELLYPKSPTLAIDFPFLNHGVRTGASFLEDLLHQVQRVAQLQDAHLYYLSPEIPIFYYFRYPELSYFKLFVYQRAIWSGSGQKSQAFSLQCAKAQAWTDTFQQIHEQYLALDSTEIWDSDWVKSTLGQLLYYAQSGDFAQPREALTLCDQLEGLLNDLIQAAANGRKYHRDGRPAGQLRLFYNNLLRTNNTLLVDSPGQRLLFVTYDDPNYFSTQDTQLWQYTRHSFERLQKRSLSITSHSERDRLRRFKQSQQHLQRTRQQLFRLSPGVRAST